MIRRESRHRRGEKRRWIRMWSRYFFQAFAIMYGSLISLSFMLMHNPLNFSLHSSLWRDISRLAQHPNSLISCRSVVSCSIRILFFNVFQYVSMFQCIWVCVWMLPLHRFWQFKKFRAESWELRVERKEQQEKGEWHLWGVSQKTQDWEDGISHFTFFYIWEKSQKIEEEKTNFWTAARDWDERDKLTLNLHN